MKNFSAKNAEFETLKINNEAAITSANIGTDPNKIPLNKDLGSLAYQDAVNLDDVSADTLELRAIAAEISDSAVDVFVYDTSRDSDGGAWRKRTQHTSWYNEELNTATRGARREFPAVAVIVAEAGKVTIYDGDDPDLGMWMVFDVVSSMNLITNSTVSSITALNGVVGVACNGTSPHFTPIDFISEKSGHYTTAGNKYFLFDISSRNNTSSPAHGSYDSSVSIVNSFVNDVAMTVLPNAPIDDDTGLPVPTIAVATDGGVSVIKDDGTVVDLNVTGRPYSSVYFSGNMVWAVENPETNYDLLRYFEIPASDITIAADYGPNSSPALFPEYTKGNVFDSFNYGSPIGITKLDHENSMVAYTTSKYNTGWMPGDIKLAALSDTTVENIGVNSDELVTNGGFVDTNNDGADDWILSNDATTSTSDTAVTITNGGANFGYIYQVVNTEIGKQYRFSVDVDYNSNEGRVFLGKEGSNTSSSSYFHEENINSDKTIEYYFTAETETLYARIGLQDNTQGGSISFDNISVRATTELITNGDFSTDATVANFATTYPDWGTWLGTCSVDNNKLSVIVSGEGEVAAAATTNFSTVVGQRYVVSFDYGYDGGASHLAFWVDDTNATGQADIYNSGNILSTDLARSRSVSFTATSSTTYLVFLAYGTAGSNVHGEFYNISVRPAVDDRSVNNNGLQIIGEINKTPVAPGADLVAYSGFSANNYLVQPYNEDLNFGTGDFCIMFWLNLEVNDAYDGIIAKKNDWLFETGQNNAISFKVWNGTTYGNTVNTTGSSNTGDAIFGEWRCLCVKRKSNVLSLFLDGIERTDPDNPFQSDTDMTSAFGLSIGYGAGVTSPAEKTLVSLLRISKTAPTPDQIAKIYRDEKVLFQDHAQSTLYGTSYSVTALAYDDKTELLHVGTSSGRSDFSGLRRINNTTTAVTTSISAHNNLIAEQ